MSSVLSRDGTSIAYDRAGKGPAVILVDGALCHRGMGPSTALAELLADRYTVFTYDRRGRGESGDSAPYAVQRELEDIEALLAAAGGTAYLWGSSSGALLALEAARRLPGIRKLALYEAPLVVDGSRPPLAPIWPPIRRAVAQGDRKEAVRIFLRAVGVPAVVAAVMRVLPVWRKLQAVAHTLPYDGSIVQDYQTGDPLPAGRWASVTIPALAQVGAKSPAWMRNGMKALADALPDGRLQVLDGQTHNVSAKRLAPVLREFFDARQAESRATGS